MVKFPPSTNNLPTNSCANVVLRDTSLMDVAAFTLASTQFDVSGRNLNEGISYTLSSPKPVDKELWRTFSVSVTINVGWCPIKKDKYNEWIRKGDYVTATQHQVMLTGNKNSYDADIVVECNGKYFLFLFA